MITASSGNYYDKPMQSVGLVMVLNFFSLLVCCIYFFRRKYLSITGTTMYTVWENRGMHCLTKHFLPNFNLLPFYSLHQCSSDVSLRLIAGKAVYAFVLSFILNQVATLCSPCLTDPHLTEDFPHKSHTCIDLDSVKYFSKGKAVYSK